MRFHDLIQGSLAVVPEWRMPYVVRKRGSIEKIYVDAVVGLRKEWMYMIEADSYSGCYLSDL
jgi:hypothetical protein